MGKLWYFRCPSTQKRCRILYSVGGYFLNREAFKGCMYESQTYSKEDRQKIRILDSCFKLNELYQELYSKHFKRYYNGKPTKRYKKILKLIKKAEGLSREKAIQMLIN